MTVIGDASNASSPLPGMGTSLAFIGIYVFASEISRQPNNIPATLESYKRFLRPYVESVRNLPPSTPWIVNPSIDAERPSVWNRRLGCRVVVGDGASHLVRETRSISSKWWRLVQVARL